MMLWIAVALRLPPADVPFLTGGDFSCNIMGFQKDWWVNNDLAASQVAWKM